MKLKKLIILTLICSNIAFTNVYAEETLANTDNTETITDEIIIDDIYNNDLTDFPIMNGTSAIVANADTERILYSKNPDQKIYPASLTKIMTLLIAREYIDPDEYIVVGNEINYVPWDSSKAGHKVGETLLGENIFKALMLPSGNDTANVVAMNVAERYTGESDMSYADAEVVFAELMNEKAAELGCSNTHFVTPHGYHDENHYTTANDMLIIVEEALKDENNVELFSTKEYAGNGAGANKTDDMITQDYDWVNTNLLLNENSSYYYPYATGIKTGYTGDAGACLASAATKDGENLITLVFNSTNPERWSDSKSAFEYTFDNYNNYYFQKDNTIVSEMYIDNPQLGADDVLEIQTKSDEYLYLTDAEAENIKKSIKINDEFISENYTEDGDTQLITPINKDTAIGTISYSIDGEEVFSSNIYASSDVLERTLKSDINFYLDKISDFIFSWKIIPTILIGGGLIILIIRRINLIKNRNRTRYKMKIK